MKINNIKGTNVVDKVNEIIQKAIISFASDIHIRQYFNNIYLEYRIEGELLRQDILEKYTVEEIIARIKVLSNLNVAEKRMPQDGSFTFTFNNEKYDIRVACLPCIYGENIVLRILNTTIKDLSLKSLGFSNKKIEILEKLIKYKNGLILITGPTGSGKSTTLLSLINILKDTKRKIISIEDPVENKVADIVQIQVNEEINLSFEKILRTTLRSDPDIIIISEIRDEITAQIAIRASLTGHLVLATLHTNDAISTFNRLLDMHIPKYLILDSLKGILSQRLIRLDEYIKTEYNKRICISELLELTEENKLIFYQYNDKEQIKKLLKLKGFSTLEDELKNRCEYEKNNSL